MPVYAVIAPSKSDALEMALKEHFKDAYYKVVDGQFLVSTALAPASQVGAAIKLSEGKLGRAIIFLVTDYNGWHSKDMWGWLKVQFQAANSKNE